VAFAYILVTQEAEIRKIVVQSQPGQGLVHQTLSQKYPTQKRASGVAQAVDNCLAN
jgi:hypothetical protein